MSDMYKRIEDLCADHRINITQMCKEAGVTRGLLTELKMGRQKSLSAVNAEKIARYFGVSVSYLLGADTGSHTVTDARDAVILQGSNNNAVSNGAPAAAEDGLNDMELELIRIYRLLDARTKNKLMSYAFQLEDSIENSTHTRRLDDLCADAQARAGAKSKGPAPDLER